MTPEYWAQIESIFHAALELPPERRGAFVDAQAQGNSDLKNEVLAMLQQDTEGVSWFTESISNFVDWALDNDPEEPSSTPPTQIGPYWQLEFLGKGGMGEVWKYQREDTGHPVAIKFVHPQPDPELNDLKRKQHRQEITHLAGLRHPNIVSFHDAGSLSDGTAWFVMDFVDEYQRGMRFIDYLRQSGWNVEKQLRFFRVICEAVLYAHQQSIVHRDLKPSNVLVAKDGSPQVVDFGIARKLTADEQQETSAGPTGPMMTPSYAAPEWRNGGQWTQLTDVYALGVMLYEVLAGRHPYLASDNPPKYLDDSNPPEKPSAVAGRIVPDGPFSKLTRIQKNDLDAICLKAMSRDTGDRGRYRSVDALIHDIDRYLNDEPLDAVPHSFGYLAAKFLRRNRRAVLTTAAMLLVTVLLVAVFMVRLAHEKNIAVTQAARTRHLQEFMADLLQGGDREAGPALNLPVTAMIDRGELQANALSNESEVQADLYETLGSMSERLGRLDKADALLSHALSERLALPVANPADTVRNRLALAMVRAEKGHTKEAVQQAHESLAEIRHDSPENRSQLGQAEMTLGAVMILDGEQKQALPFLGNAVTDLEASEGSSSPRLAHALSLVGDANIYAGNYDAADAANRRALAIDRAVYGENHPHVAGDLNNLAQTLEIHDKSSQAEPLELEAVTILTKWYGPDHPETAARMVELSEILMHENKFDEARGFLLRALAVIEHVYGPDHPRLAYVLNSLGILNMSNKKFSDAEDDYRRMAAIYTKAFGDSDYRVAVATGNLASVYSAEKNYAQAERVQLDALARFIRALGANDVQTGQAQARLGRILLHEKKYTEAAQHSLAGYEAIQSQMSPDSAWVRGAREDLAYAYTALHQPEKAKLYRVPPTPSTTK
jgi:eukaryotic-like serine/threonine-protein kinase